MAYCLLCILFISFLFSDKVELWLKELGLKNLLAI